MSSSALLNLDILQLLDSSFDEKSPEISGPSGKTPIIRWAGSKKKLLSALQIAAPDTYNTYYEPFFGSGIFFLHLDSPRSVISDLNPHLMQAYEVLKNEPKLLWQTVSSIPSDREAYYYIRGLDSKKLDNISKAARFIYLNRFCFNGVYRTNLQGGFNVSRGKGNLGIPSLEVFTSFSKKLQRCNVHNQDFEVIVNKAKSGDFVYLDPPYIDQDKRDRGEYGVDSFKFEDLNRLVLCVNRATKRGVKVLISYRECSYLKSLLPDWYIEQLSVQRNVSCHSASRKKAQEIFLSNYIL